MDKLAIFINDNLFGRAEIRELEIGVRTQKEQLQHIDERVEQAMGRLSSAKKELVLTRTQKAYEASMLDRQKELASSFPDPESDIKGSLDSAKVSSVLD
jgi:hypothetical protein